MPQFSYRARDKTGQMRQGTRSAASIDVLNTELINEGIFPVEIKPFITASHFLEDLKDALQGEALHKSELAIFARQMKLLHQAGVPIVTAFRQLAAHTRSRRLGAALLGMIDSLEKGQSLANAFQQYPKVFSPLIINIMRMGENTGHLEEAFEHIHQYLEFDANNLKQVKTAFRYPLFILLSIMLSIIVLNIFVIPSFGRFYSNLTVALPWQTQLLIGSSNLFTHYGLYLLALLVGCFMLFLRYLHTTAGRLRWDKFLLHIPLLGNLIKRITLIRFSQSLGIMLSAGIPVTQALALVRDIIANRYVAEQIAHTQEEVERGSSFVQSLAKMVIFTQLEIQILAVGEKNGELSPALKYIANYHSEEIVYELKRLSDVVGPIMIGVVSGLILIIALGVYLPIWNMVNLIHS